MKNYGELPIVSKLTLIIDSNILEEYFLSTDFCSLLPIHNKNKIVESCNENLTDTNSNKICLPNIDTCSCQLDTLTNCVHYKKIKLKMELLLFSIVMTELKRSEVFRANVLSRLNTISNLKSANTLPSRNMRVLSKHCMHKLHITIHLLESRRQVFNFSWNKRLQILINEKYDLENAMAWLSTLGGAFSALGDTYVKCAEKAGLISGQQLRLALQLGDPLTICRCKIYLAMSLLQRGHYSRTKTLIRDLYAFSEGPEGSKDFKLKNMCLAVWNRLKYVLSENKKSRSSMF